MKKLFYFLLVAVTFAVGCSESFDDSEIWDKLNDHENRIAKLEELCKQMNTNISSLQTLVNALNQNDYITNVAPVSKNGEEIGYTITFTSGKTITIYHGKNGQDGADGKDGINGENGADGKDGNDGSTPIIGVKLFDGVYYWTLNGEWLLDDNGNKIKAQGTDGKDGQDGEDGKDGNDGATGPQGPAGEDGADGEVGKDGQNGTDGKDGITPQLKIENGYWFISYDNGSSWKQLGKATGEDGKDGQDGQNGADGANGQDGKDGDSFFQNVTQDDEYVYFTLADGTQISILKASAMSSIEMSYVPRYDDGKAMVTFTTAEDSKIEMDFQIMPKSAAAIIAKDWQTPLSLKAVETQTRAVEYIDMPISECTADETNGTITIIASGKNLPQTFFDAETKVRAALFYDSAIGGTVSEYVELVAQLGESPKPEISNNQILYTAFDKIIPFAADVFGANMLEFLKAILFGIVEGITEWLPVSSTGHLILLDELVKLDVSEAFYEMFQVVIQLGAILAVILLFFHKLNPFSAKKTVEQKNDTWKLWMKVVAAVLPSALIGLVLDDWMDAHLYNYLVVALMLVVYGVAFLVVEGRNKSLQPKAKDVNALDMKTALLIGCFQCLSLIPGTSRSGATILGGILLGVSRTAASEFSFFLAIPTMLGASALKILKFLLDGATMSGTEVMILVVGCVVSFLVSMAAIKGLMGYVRKRSFALFGYYRIALGLLVILYFLLAK